MKLELKNLSIGSRFALALAMPIAGLLFLAAWLSLDYHRNARQVQNLENIAELAPAMGALIHELQMERGLTTGFISGQSAEGQDGSTRFSRRLPAQHAVTDKRSAQLTVQLDRHIHGGLTDSLSETLGARIASMRRHLERLANIRHEVDARSIDMRMATDYYTETIAKLIAIGDQMLLVSTQPELTRTIAAYNHLLHAKEQAGQERALGTAGFTAQQFDAPAHARLIELIERQRFHLGAFRFFATPAQLDVLKQTLNERNEAEIERMRQIALQSREVRSTRGIVAAQWFDRVSGKIDQLRALEEQLASDMLATARESREAATFTAWRISMLAFTLLALTIAFAAALARGILLPLTQMTSTMEKLAAADTHIEIGDAARNDEIGALARAAQVFHQNQTEMAEARERLKSTAALRIYHQALSSITQGVLIVDKPGNVIYANFAFNEIFGFSVAEFPDELPAPLDHQQGVDSKCLKGLLPAFAHGRYFQGDLQCRRKNGDLFWCTISVAPVLDATDQTTHLVAVLHDVTKSRRVEQELRIAATAFESLHGMMVTDAEGIILRVNKAFVDMTGYSAAEAVGQSPAILKSGRHPAEFYADMWQQLAIAGSWSGEIWDRRKNGETFPKWQTISAVRGSDGRVTHYVSAFTDISERKAAEQRIHDLAFYDPLTRLPNRRLLIDRLQQAVSLSSRNQHYGALLFIDLDQFKTLNDTLGHDMGDLLLIQVAERLQSCLRGSDTAARLGGDEFVVMLEHLGDTLAPAITDAETVGTKILETLNQNYDLAGKPYHSSPSIGVTLFRGQESSSDELLKQADLAMYQAKAAGRNAMHFYDPQMQAAVTQRSELESDLRHALQEMQFVLHYQPQVDVAGRTLGAEALIRWQHPRRGLVSPAEFIPLAEETGLIIPLGYWVLEQAASRLAEWGQYPATANLTLAINVSARQFRQPDFVAQILAMLATAGANPERLKLELTESLLLDNIESTITKMEALKSHGISFSLDDFGTGYSSLAYLKRLPLDQLKIDRSFVHDILTNSNDAVIAKSIIALAQSLGLQVIAEGVETEGQRAFLTEHHCGSFQGFLFGRPAPATDLPPAP
jgi:diguanylate cyclase (GGDEF)-like protein/PAS domain S-box-containing protein